MTTERGKKLAVVLDLKKHGDLWEDIYDVLIARRRHKEPPRSVRKLDLTGLKRDPGAVVQEWR